MRKKFFFDFFRFQRAQIDQKKFGRFLKICLRQKWSIVDFGLFKIHLKKQQKIEKIFSPPESLQNHQNIILSRKQKKFFSDFLGFERTKIDPKIEFRSIFENLPKAKVAKS